MKNENIKNPKCSTCKCYFVPIVKTSGLQYKTCEKCQERGKLRKKGHIVISEEQKKEKKKQYNILNAEKIKNRKREYNILNAEKIKEQKKEYNILNEEKIKEQKKLKYKENKKIYSLQTKNWRKNNKEYVKEYFRKYFKAYREHIKLFNFKLYLVNLQRGQINRCLKNSKLKKSKHSIEYLGCTIEEFISYFEKKIEYFNNFIATSEIMTWDNIHIDHIKPVSLFNLDDEEEFLDCCHYSNLQPLISTDNLEKHNKWEPVNNIYWLENIKGKEYLEIYIP